MFDFLFGWRRAPKCKKLIRRVQWRLKLLKNKRCAIARHFREDVAQLWKNGYQHIAFNRLDELCMDEGMIQVYELLEQFSEFVIINLAYIRRHKDLPTDVNEAISTLIFASAWCSDLPELKLIRKLFGKRYGSKLVASAIELHPGNLVNSQVKDKLTMRSVTENEKFKLLEEIVGDIPELLDLNYKPDSRVNTGKQFTDFYTVRRHDHECIKDNISPTISTTCSIVPQSSPSPSIFKTPIREKRDEINELNSPTDDSEAIKPEIRSESSTDQQYSDQGSLIYLDDVQEFRSPIKQDCDYRDQRFFIFRSSILSDNSFDEKSCYSYKSEYQKRIEIEDNERFCLDDNDEIECSLDQSICFCTSDEDYDQDQGVENSQIGSNPEVNKAICMVSPPYVHPKLPDYDELAARFRAIKRVNQENLIRSCFDITKHSFVF